MSGIYIPGMEMPKVCHECRLYEADIYYCAIADRPLDVSNSEIGRCSFCPLIPVPDHGRLIDERDALDAVRQGAPTQVSIDGFSKILFDAPTIIPADKEDGE